MRSRTRSGSRSSALSPAVTNCTAHEIAETIGADLQKSTLSHHYGSLREAGPHPGSLRGLTQIPVSLRSGRGQCQVPRACSNSVLRFASAVHDVSRSAVRRARRAGYRFLPMHGFDGYMRPRTSSELCRPDRRWVPSRWGITPADTRLSGHPARGAGCHHRHLASRSLAQRLAAYLSAQGCPARST